MSTLEVIVIIEISCDTMPNYNLEIVAVLYAIPLVVLKRWCTQLSRY